MKKIMFNFTSSIESIDEENRSLILAAKILQELGNDPGMTTNDFYVRLITQGHPVDAHEQITLAAIAIETMMSGEDEFEETIH